jgi:hypothetical protein
MRVCNAFNGFRDLFNPGFVIILQCGVRKKPSAVANTLHRDVFVFASRVGFLWLATQPLENVIIFSWPWPRSLLGDFFAEQPETRLRYRGGAQQLCHSGVRGNGDRCGRYFGN